MGILKFSSGLVTKSFPELKNSFNDISSSVGVNNINDMISLDTIGTSIGPKINAVAIPGQGKSLPKQSNNDYRIRLRPKSTKAWDVIFGKPGSDNILSVLHPSTGRTNGVIFPYTPNIVYDYSAGWSDYNVSQTNYTTHAFDISRVSSITITGTFTAQDTDEAIYSYAVIHFFRTITKMYYGKQDLGTVDNPGMAGTPPPTLLLSGYGEGIFNDVPVVVTSFSHYLLKDVDMVDVPLMGGKMTARIPVKFDINLSLLVQQDLIKVNEEFKLDDFRTGKMYLNNKGYL